MNQYNEILNRLRGQFERNFDFNSQESQADFIEGMLEFAKLICASSKSSKIIVSAKPEDIGGEMTGFRVEIC